MKTNIIKDLEKRLLMEHSNITLGDTSETTLLNLHIDECTSTESILISLYNMAKINQCKIKKIETNLDLLASRVYKTDEDFAEDEKYEIREALVTFELEELANNFNKERLHDMLYADIEDFDLMHEKQKELMNKIKYPTLAMYETFNKLVTEQIENMG